MMSSAIFLSDYKQGEFNVVYTRYFLTLLNIDSPFFEVLAN